MYSLANVACISGYQAEFLRQEYILLAQGWVGLALEIPYGRMTETMELSFTENRSRRSRNTYLATREP